MRLSEKIRELVDFFPWVTSGVLAKHLKPEIWKTERHKSIYQINNILYPLRNKSLTVVPYTNPVIYVKRGRDKRVGQFYFNHNQAVISILMNLYLKGYKVKYGGDKSADGTIETEKGKMYLEVDTGNHTSNASISHQVLKHTDPVLFVSYPKFSISDSEDNKEAQFKQMKQLMEKIKRLNLPAKNLYFSTYIEASDPMTDPLTSKIWKKIDGKNCSIV